jgi:hypothetical protein
MAVISRRHLLRDSLAAALATATAGCLSRGQRAVAGRLIDPGASLGHRLVAGSIPPTSIVRRAQVVIAGAGIAGLAAAHALRKDGIEDVLVVDVLDQAGGNASYGRNAVSAYPWGAHYVPLVRQDCHPVLELFRDLRIIVDEDKGLPVYDEYCISADPQERLWMYGRWQEGLVPQIGARARDRAQFAAFFQEMESLKARIGDDGKPLFAIPVDASSADPAWRALDLMTMTDYLKSKGWDSQLLQWYVNYCCRDDYGSKAGDVSAWAGLHYFAARNGVAANAESTSVVTWPEGNGHLVRELVRLGGAQQQPSSLVTRVAATKTGAVVEYFDGRLERSVRVEAQAVIVCLPRFVVARVVEGFTEDDASDFSYAPWMVANLTLSRLPGGRGQALAWDNVIIDSPLLGYVVATHQSLEQTRRETVITYYWPLSDLAPAAARRIALARSLEEWQKYVLDDLLRVHPELDGHVENVDVRVWGHAMIRPTPGFLWGARRGRAGAHRPPVFFAHSDLSGISIFEEAYCRGFAAGALAARRVRDGSKASLS